MMSKALARTLADRAPQEAALAEAIAQEIGNAIVRTRAIARGLCPVGLSAFGFVNGLEELARSVEERHRVPCQVHGDRSIAIEGNFVAPHLFQIVSEAVNNSVHHSHARKIEIALDSRPAGLLLSVRDDGVGLPKDVDRAAGMGLRTMRHRANLLGATLEICSPPTGGTVVSCLLPAAESPIESTAPTLSRT
jgi:signal transduction histidine kinase